MDSYFTAEELSSLGLKNHGKNVRISRKASIYGAEWIAVGSNVRVDDFCILSGRITLGNYIHIAAQTMLFGGEHGIVMEDFTTISSRCAVYAVSDDYSGHSLSYPACPPPYRKTCGGEVLIKRHALIGSGCTLLPGICLGEGAAIGAMSLVVEDTPPWTIGAGIPCRVIKARSQEAIALEKEYLRHIPGENQICPR
jgi:galactoside O-acetyltransferase